jgi:Predicted Zn-dependent protease
MLYYGMDRMYLLVVIATIVAIITSARVNSIFSKYSKIRSKSGMTGAQVATKILKRNGIYDVNVETVHGKLSDHYDPRSKTIRLSESVYGSASIAAIAVAAHECGHAIQHNEEYEFLKFRTAFLPVANIGNKLAWPIIMVGLFIGYGSFDFLIEIGILLFAATVLFQVITLPVEFNASKRALIILEDMGILASDEIPISKKVLNAAAKTYLTTAIVAILQLLRLLSIFGGRRRGR